MTREAQSNVARIQRDPSIPLATSLDQRSAGERRRGGKKRGRKKAELAKEAKPRTLCYSPPLSLPPPPRVSLSLFFSLSLPVSLSSYARPSCSPRRTLCSAVVLSSSLPYGAAMYSTLRYIVRRMCAQAYTLLPRVSVCGRAREAQWENKRIESFRNSELRESERGSIRSPRDHPLVSLPLFSVPCV